MNTVKQMVQDNKQVFFTKYVGGEEGAEIWYTTECGFEFPIPSEDLKGATFPAKDKAILYMRWINKHLKTIAQAKALQD